ncbi:hypothetical protein BABA_21076 [Neobacillus bataviensis LMG 21833]|uniref:DUF4829 domain-containing protein n=1 Tax=Neobacillus bataviensis LMG 21833 TaxID=1117379 RepID=K6DAS7_9BACI|nr:hypothetical protein [Neobacillus bataviensis]EKN65178.1 hypothetical protein BABA_21076 [Neobacillus bataviensis LMG 21833]
MRKRQSRVGLFIGVFIVIILIIVMIKSMFFSAEEQAQRVVDEFYTYEQEGNFTDSWELFHPFMKERWEKSTYINDRAHVFMGHFGAETFDYSIEYLDKVEKWRMAKDKKPFKEAYHFQVLQMYKGKYGKFNFEQDVYVVKNKDSWGILWDYQQ